MQKQKLVIGDSRNLKALGIEDESVDLIFSHPPYWNLVNYSEEHGFAKGDLSTVPTLEEFLDGMHACPSPDIRIQYQDNKIAFVECKPSMHAFHE